MAAHQSAEDVPNNLPKNLKKLVGREVDVDSLLDKVRENAMVTIAGTGGSGKSRLAVEVGRLLKPDFPGGVWFIALADLADQAEQEHLLPSRIGKSIGIPEKPSAPPHHSLIDYFAQGKHLLILDNCEHLAASCREVTTTLLNACAELKVLATSRVKLDAVPFEEIYPLDPLAVPAAGDLTAETILQSGAVRLFLERAGTAVKATSNLDDLLAVTGICQDLAGIPLAIEIAAARLRMRTVQELRKETSRLFSKDSTDAGKWQLLSNAIQWSYRLLNEELRSFARALSVFDGGFSLESAGAVCQDPGKPGTTEDAVQALVDLSLVVNRASGVAMRFRFLVPIRQFLQQQTSAAELAEWQKRHAGWCITVAERSAPKLLTGEQNETLEFLQEEVDNFRAALRWLIHQQEAESALRLMVALWRFTEIRAYYTEGLARAQEVLAVQGVDGFPDLHCKLLSGAGMLAYRMAKFSQAHGFFDRCLNIATARQDPIGIADALSGLGLVAMMAGDFAAAQDYQTRCRDMERINRNDRNAAVATFNLGFNALGTGHYQDAAKFLREALDQFLSVGNNRGIAFAYNSLARCFIVSKDLETADDYAQKSLKIRRELQDSKTVADALRTLAWSANERGDQPAALTYLKEAVGLARGVDDSRGIAEALELFALVNARLPDTKRVIVLAAAAAQLRGAYGYALPPALIAEREAALQAAREQLCEEDFSRHWTRGSQMKSADAIAEALKASAPPNQVAPNHVAPNQATPNQAAPAQTKATERKKIFVSYTHADQTVALRVRDHLSTHGFAVVIDCDAMQPGERIQDFIQDSVENADAVVSIVSPLSLISAWVALETVASFDREKAAQRKLFIGCTLTHDFGQLDYRQKCTDQIEKRLAELQAQYRRYAAQFLDPVDLDEERSRLYALRNDLGTIIARLNDCLCLDIGDQMFNHSMTRLVAALSKAESASRR